MTDPQGGVSNYIYDALNRLTSLANPSAQSTTFGYDALSRRTSLNHANGVVSSYSYDVASQLLSLTHQVGATTINSFSYTLDRVGNRQTKADGSGTASYTYDALNRLTQTNNPIPTNPLETYTYDPVGNRTNSNQNGASLFNQANQLTEDATFTYQYDASGNQIRKTRKATGAFTLFDYDAENRLIRVVREDGSIVNYRYDALGRRIEKEVDAVLTRYIYDQEDILLELDGANTIVARYTHGAGIDEPLITDRSGQSFFYHADGLGSVTEITDSTGALRQEHVYSSFGKIEAQLDGSFVQPYTFTSREFDPETNLYFYRARFYNPNIGRFNEEDPLFAGKPFPITNPNSSHLYVYVVNNPATFTDPSGLGPCEDTLQDCLQAVNARHLACLANVVKVTSICLASCAVICFAVALPPSPAYPVCVSTCIARACVPVATGGAAACTGASLSGRINCLRDYDNCKNGRCK